MKKITLQTMCLATLTAAMLAGCSKSESQTTPETPVAAEGTIRAVASVQKSIEVDTKAPNVATSAEGLQVYVVAYNEFFAKMFAKGTMTFKLGLTEADAVTFDSGFTGANLLPLDNTSVWMTAVYPATKWSINGQYLEREFTGCEDIMADLKSSARKDENIPVFATFEMRHYLTRFDITAKAADPAAQAAWGKIKSIVFKMGDNSVFNDYVMFQDDDLASFSWISKNALPKWPSYQITKPVDKIVYTDDKFAAADFASSVALTTTATPVCYTMMAPVDATAATNEIVLEITTLDKEGGADIVTEVDIDLDHTGGGYTGGVFFSVNLTFKVKDIKATASITKWSAPVVIDKVID